MNNKVDEQLVDLVVRSGSNNLEVALAAQAELAVALTEPLREGILDGDILSPFFSATPWPKGAAVEYELDFLAPGEEDLYIAYTNPGNGRIPERNIEGDFLTIPTYRVTNSIDWLLRHAEEARTDVVGRAGEVMRAGFVKKLNDDGFHTLLSAAADRNILVYDADANAGQFTKRLVSLMKVVMRRNGGGNSSSINRRKLTDIVISPEGVEDIRNWNLDQIDEVTRREFMLMPDGRIPSIFQVRLHDYDEFGTGQEYQNYYTNNLSGVLANGDEELILGLDLTNAGQKSFVMPLKQQLEVFADPMLHRQQRAGFYGWMQVGFGVLDNRYLILGSY